MSNLSARAEEIFLSVASLSGEEQGVLVAELCSSNAELRALVESLMAAEPRGRELLARVAREIARGEGASNGGASALSPGRRLGDYELRREIGRGGMGVVWEALQTSIGRRVALKVLPPERLLRPRSIERFRREAEAAARVTHEGLVAIHGIGSEEGIDYIAQEFVEGARTLANLIEEQRRLPSLSRDHDREMARLFLDAARALEAVHAAGIVHRDLKPSNILLTPSGRPKIADFGLARLEGEPGLSLTGELVGTPSYMSPEQAAGKSELDARSDVFSLGATLYEALTLRRPFDGESRGEVLARIQREDPLDARALRPRIPLDLGLIVGKALEKDPRRRYASMSELAEDLRRFLAHEPIRARPPTPWQKAAKWVRRHPTRSVAGVLALASLLAIGALGLETLRRTAALAAQGKDLGRLSAMHQLELLVGEADSLNRMWPPYPPQIPAYRDWIESARTLLRELPEHRLKLAELEVDIAANPSDAKTTTRWWRERLVALVRGLEDLQAKLLDEEALSPEYGWSVPRRLAFAELLEREFGSGGAFAERWRTTLPAIRAAYPGIEIEPHMGLVPIGPDPASGLWEFWHVASGEEPRRSTDGKLEYEARSGIVLVLLPGGAFWMGAQSNDPEQPNYDPAARPEEGPVHLVTLSPFFFSKYELTQVQWRRCTEDSPSEYRTPNNLVATPSDLHPVEHVDSTEARRLLRRLDLDFPREAQWEYAARAGTQWPWWTGNERETLIGAANLADASIVNRAKIYNPLASVWPELDDGYPVHAPVHTMRPNAFGLHHMLGNVLEMCFDPWFNNWSYRLPIDQNGRRTGLAASTPARHVVRGGHFGDESLALRSAFRRNEARSTRSSYMGVRPARNLVAGDMRAGSQDGLTR